MLFEEHWTRRQAEATKGDFQGVLAETRGMSGKAEKPGEGWTYVEGLVLADSALKVELVGQSGKGHHAGMGVRLQVERGQEQLMESKPHGRSEGIEERPSGEEVVPDTDVDVPNVEREACWTQRPSDRSEGWPTPLNKVRHDGMLVSAGSL